MRWRSPRQQKLPLPHNLPRWCRRTPDLRKAVNSNLCRGWFQQETWPNDTLASQHQIVFGSYAGSPNCLERLFPGGNLSPTEQALAPLSDSLRRRPQTLHRDLYSSASEVMKECRSHQERLSPPRRARLRHPHVRRLPGDASKASATTLRSDALPVGRKRSPLSAHPCRRPAAAHH